MSRMSSVLSITLCAIVLAALCVSTQAQTKPSDSAKPMGEQVENPSYKAWAAFKPGSSATLKGTTQAQGQNINVESTSTLVSVNDDKATVEVATKVNANGNEMPQPTRKIDVSHMVAKSELDQPGKGFDPDLLKKASEESVTVPAGTFKAKVIEFTRTQGPMTMKIKAWFSEEVPGGMVKQEMNGEGQQGGQSITMQTTMELASVDKK